MTNREKILSIIILLLVVTMIQIPEIITATLPASPIKKIHIELQRKKYEEKIRLLEEEIRRLKSEYNDVNREI